MMIRCETVDEVLVLSRRLMDHPRFREFGVQKQHVLRLMELLPKAPVIQRVRVAEHLARLSFEDARYASAFLLCALSSQVRDDRDAALAVRAGLELVLPGNQDPRVELEFAKTVCNLSITFPNSAGAAEFVERIASLPTFGQDERVREAYARGLANAAASGTIYEETGPVALALTRHPDFKTSAFVQLQAARALARAAGLLEFPEEAAHLAELLPPGPLADEVMEAAGSRYPPNLPALPELVFPDPDEAPTFVEKLFEAAAGNDVDALREVARAMPGALKSVGLGPQNLLHCAAQNGARECVRYLVAQGLSPNSPTLKSRVTPLFYAVRSGYLEIARELLAAGADPRATISENDPRYGGMSLIEVARAAGHEDLVEMLGESRAEDSPR